MLMLLLSTSLLHLENAVSSLRPSVTESSPASCSMIGPERPAEGKRVNIISLQGATSILLNNGLSTILLCLWKALG